MKALTISQPYASLIASGTKWVENRTWHTPYRGTLAIHAGKGTQYLTRLQLESAGYRTGCIIAVAKLVACVELERVKKFSNHWGASFNGPAPHSKDEFLNHEYTEGPWCWVLRDVRKLESSVACRGAQGLWNIDESMIGNPGPLEVIR